MAGSASERKRRRRRMTVRKVDNMNSTAQDGLSKAQSDMSEPDVFSIISEANTELSKRTGSKIIQYGDVLVDTTRNSVVCSQRPKNCLWPSSQDGNVYVPYVIDKIYSKMLSLLADHTEDQTKVIWKSLHEISSLTCVKFYYRRSNEPGYISVQSENGCYSYVGYRPIKRKLSLKVPGCVHFGLVAHEFLHAIGFQHEHSRSDRDKYLKIMWENVPKGKEHNFNLLETNNLGTVYDYGSIMHYGRYAFSKNKNPTMVPIPDPNVEIGQARGLSTKDVIKINKLYSCVHDPLYDIAAETLTDGDLIAWQEPDQTAI
ncbi:low choriolytic enzyme-like [Stegostoma tigrinum]|uniref:low choriolytic enzyme-like n=1 Tax=Stegostoma tigrinum TaxID=3053191 RepID=UPI00286FED0C|nr:low choriolytic enzyme-like [Stegostoma tigrinum]